MKCLGVDYSKDKGKLGLSIAELKHDKIKIIESLVLEPTNNKKKICVNITLKSTIVKKYFHMTYK